MLTSMHRHHQRRRSTGDQDSHGFTLIEVVVAIVLLAIIMVPLTAAFIQGIRRSAEVDQRFARSADLQRITSNWNKDVNSLDADGYNPSIGACLTAASFDDEGNIIATNSTVLATFQWDTRLPGVQPKRATWLVVGAGSDATLVRRYCEGEQLPVESTMADSFGVDGLDVLQMVWGQTAGSNNMCTTLTCTINIGGAYSYTVTAERRVPGDEILDATPPPPEIVDCQAGPGQVLVTWNPSILTSTQSPVVEYQASLFGDAVGAGNPISSVYVDGESTSASIPALVNAGDETFWVRVKARNAQGYGVFGLSCGPVTPDPSPPGRPTNVVATPADKTASVDWTDPSSGGSPITNYTIFLKDVVDDTETQFSTSSKPFQLPGGILTNARPYQFAVQATNLLGTGPKSLFSPVIYPFGPTLPQSVPAWNVLPGGRVVITWYVIMPPSAPICLTPPSDQNDAAIAASQCISNGMAPFEYRIDILATDGQNLVPIPGYPKLLPQPSLPANPPLGLRMGEDIQGLPRGLSYNVLITPINGAGDGSPAIAGEFVVPADPPGPVGLPDVLPTGGTGELQFTIRPPVDDGGAAPTRYEIIGPDGRSAEVAATQGNTSFTWNGQTTSGPALVNFESYLFNIRACNGPDRCGPWSPGYWGMPFPSPELADVSVAYPGGRTASISFRFATGTGWAPAAVERPQRYTFYLVRCNDVAVGPLPFPSSAIQTVSFTDLPLGPADCDIQLFNGGEATFGGFLTTANLQSPRIPVPVTVVEPPGLVGAASVYSNGSTGQLQFEIPEPTETNGGAVTSYLIAGPGGRSATAPATTGTTTFTWSPATSSGPALTDFTPYAFTIQACNSAGCGSPSPSYVAMPVPAPQISDFATSVPSAGTARLEFGFEPSTGWAPPETSPVRSSSYTAQCGSAVVDGDFISAAAVQVDFLGLPAAPVSCTVILRSTGVATFGGTQGTISKTSAPTVASFIVARPPGAIGAAVGIRATGLLNQPPTGASSSLDFVIPAPLDPGDLGVSFYDIRGSGGRSATVPYVGESTTFPWNPASASGPRLEDFTRTDFEIRACTTDVGCGPWSPSFRAMSAPRPLMEWISATSPSPGVATLTFRISPGRGTPPIVEHPEAKTEWRLTCGSGLYESGLVLLVTSEPITIDVTGLPAGSISCSLRSRNDVQAVIGGFQTILGLGQSPTAVNRSLVIQ
jgi:prepilin-type N-terminal cleavage/methylation domain-containing protein